MKKLFYSFLFILISANYAIASLSTPTNYSPSSGSTNQYPSLLLNWYSVTNATTYEIKIGTSPALSSFTLYSSASTSYTVNNLLFSSNYYWQVRAKSAGDSSSWSTIWNFTTITTASLYTPTSGSIDQYPGVLLDWYTVSGASCYQVELDTSINYNSPLYARYTTSASYSEYTTSNLLFGKKYYWRVRTGHSEDTSAWTASWHFTILNTAFLYAPTSGSTAQNPSVLLDWYGVSGASCYQVELDTSANYNSPLRARYTTSASYSEFTTSNLLFGKKYYWKVRAAHSADTSAWTTSWNFTTLNTASLYAPTSGSTAQNPSVLLDWYGVSGASCYQVELDTSANYNSPLHATYTTSSSYSEYTTANLLFGKKYYWRVRTGHSTDTSAWTASWNFTTLNTVSLYSPGNTSQYNNTDITIDWNGVTGSAYYDYMCDTSILFNSTSLRKGFTTSSYSDYTFNDLAFGKTWYWKVRARHQSDSCLWSSVWNFGINNSPTLNSPANNSTAISLNPTIYWNSFSGITYYRYQYDSDPLFSNPTEGYMSVGTSQKTLSNLSYGTTYYWRVKAMHTNDTSLWSPVWNFTTLYQMPSGPTLISPANSTTNLAIPINLQWNSINGALVYQYQVDVNSNFSNPLTGNTTQLTAAVTSLMGGTIYYWRIRANNGSGYSPWSSTWVFTTQISLNAPQLVSPANNAVSQVLSLIIDWSDVSTATSYEFQYATSAAFSSYTSGNSTISQSQISGLNMNTTYYWRVRASDGTNLSAWSGIWSFTTLSLVAPVLIYPSNYAVNIPINVLLNWNDAANATAYEYQYSTDSTFNNTAVYTTVISEGQLNNLAYLTTYYWRVRSTMTTIVSTWSDKFSFTTLTNIGITENKKNVIFIYPMPANDKINILLTASFMQPKIVLIFDASGKEVYRNIENSNSFSINTIKFKQGLYLLQIGSGENRIMEKILIEK